jgi:hypothetical protein
MAELQPAKLKPTTPQDTKNPFRTPEGKLTKMGRISLQKAGEVSSNIGEVKPVKAARTPQTKMQTITAAGDVAVAGARSRFVPKHVEKIATMPGGEHITAADATAAANAVFDRDHADRIRFAARREQAQRVFPADERTPEEKTSDAQVAAERQQKLQEASHEAHTRSWGQVVKEGLALVGKKAVDTETGETVGNLRSRLNGPGVSKMDPVESARIGEQQRAAALETPEGKAWLARVAANTANKQGAAAPKKEWPALEPTPAREEPENAPLKTEAFLHTGPVPGSSNPEVAAKLEADK